MARQRDYKAEYARRQARAKAEGYRTYGAKRYAKEQAKIKPANQWQSLVELEFLTDHKLTVDERKKFALAFMPYPLAVKRDINRVKHDTQFDHRKDTMQDIDSLLSPATRRYRARSIRARQEFTEEFPDFDYRVWKVDYRNYTHSDSH